VRVLVADDSALIRRVLDQRLSKWGYEAVLCPDGEEAWDALHGQAAPLLAIVDWDMPRLSGVELCRRVRAEAREPYVYLILLTANDRKEAVVEGLSAGADDYVKKPFDDQELEVRLRTGKRIVDLHGELVAAREAMRVQATRDSLTGLWNRAAVMDALHVELARCDRSASPLAVMMVDLDHFKRVNDTWGHQAGDAVLRESARRLAAGIRTYDVAGRYGGEEFLLLLPGCAESAASGRADAVRASVSAEPMDVGGVLHAQTVSIGVTIRRSGEAIGVEDLIKSADAALYEAKRGGRDRVVFSVEKR
jgi:diguanylate cyclase (GGDEF)-like protein